MKIAVLLAATGTLALSGCMEVQKATGLMPDQQIADAKLLPCIASTIAQQIGPSLGKKGSGIRKTNRQSVRVANALCPDTTTTAAK